MRVLPMGLGKMDKKGASFFLDDFLIIDA